MIDSTMTKAPSRVLLINLRRIFATRFNEEELRTLCFDLGVDYDNLPAKGKEGKARELVAYYERRDSIGELVRLGRQQIRSDIPWDDLSSLSLAGVLFELKHESHRPIWWAILVLGIITLVLVVWLIKQNQAIITLVGTPSATSPLLTSKPPLPTIPLKASMTPATTESKPTYSRDATRLPTPISVAISTITATLPTSGTILAYGSVITREIRPSGDIDIYNFEGKAGDRVLIVAVGTDEAPWLSLVIEILDPQGRAIVKDSRSTYYLTADGLYTVRIRESGTRMGLYVLKLGLGTKVNYGYVATEEIRPAGEIDAYNFEGKAGDIALMALTDRSVNERLNVVMNLLDPNGKEVASKNVWVGDTAVIEQALATDGKYTVMIWATGQLDSIQTGTYTWLLKNISSHAGIKVSYGDVVSEKIDPPGDVDIYNFEWRTGDMPLLEVIVKEIEAENAGYSCDFYVEVFDLQRNSLAVGKRHTSLGDSSTLIRVKPLLTNGGTYTIAVGEKGQISGFCTGSYTVSVKNLAVP